MKLKNAAAVLALGLLVALSVVPGGSSHGRPTCQVSNERAGSGSRSLQDAIDAAAPGDTLVVKGTCFGTSSIDKNLRLKGVSNPAFGDATLDGSGSGGAVLSIAAPTANLDVAVDSLTITHGSGDGICSCGFAGHDITLTRTTVSDNDGSGITGFFGHVTLVDSTVSSNGSGISGRISSTLLRSSIRDNDGIGIAASRSGDSSLTDSTVTGNRQGGMVIFRSFVSIAGSSISDNDGSGITLFEGAVSLSVSSVLGNETGGSGGGINVIDGAAQLVNSNVTGNTAALDGGGMNIGTLGSFTLTDSMVSGNTAGRSGGGIFNLGTAALHGTNTFANNTPQDCVGVSGC